MEEEEEEEEEEKEEEEVVVVEMEKDEKEGGIRYFTYSLDSITHWTSLHPGPSGQQLKRYMTLGEVSQIVSTATTWSRTVIT